MRSTAPAQQAAIRAYRGEAVLGYRRFDSYFLSAGASAPIVAGLNLPPSADAWLAERTASLDRRLRRIAHDLSNGRLGGVRLIDGRLQITPVRTDTDIEAKASRNRIDGLMPRIRITELLHDVASETDFLAGFTNLRTGRRSDNPNALLAQILITPNRSVGEWGGVFGDPVVATAILDRLLHYSAVITIRGDSYRLRLRTQRPQRREWGSVLQFDQGGQIVGSVDNCQTGRQMGRYLAST